MGFAGGVDVEPFTEAEHSTPGLGVAGGLLAGRQHGDETGSRRRVLDDTRPRIAESGQLTKPVDHDFLNLGEARR